MIIRGVDEAAYARAGVLRNTFSSTADVDVYLDNAQKVSEGEEAACVLTVRYRNQLSVCVHWMQETHWAQWEDFLCASGALDGQLHFHIRQACSGDKCTHAHTKAKECILRKLQKGGG